MGVFVSWGTSRSLCGTTDAKADLSKKGDHRVINITSLPSQCTFLQAGRGVDGVLFFISMASSSYIRAHLTLTSIVPQQQQHLLYTNSSLQSNIYIKSSLQIGTEISRNLYAHPESFTDILRPEYNSDSYR